MMAITREDVALAILPHLLTQPQPARSVTRSPYTSAVREALAIGDEFMFQAALSADAVDQPRVVGDLPVPCIHGYSSHSWHEGACVRCHVDRVTYERVRDNLKNRRQRQRQAAA